MARPYSRDELLKLRESPLVRKPASLPPAEEWMGPIPEQNQVREQSQRKPTNKGRHEEAFANDGTANRRPLFESKRSTNVPEDIILGPPKTAFASASGARNTTKTFDSLHRPSFNNHDDPPSKNDRTNHRERHPKDGQKSERDGDKSRDSRPGIIQNRRSVKDESELWSNVRQQRPSGQDDAERSHRRNGDRNHDRDRDGVRDSRSQRGFENHRREGDRDIDGENGVRRAGLGRGRNEPSWYKEDARTEEGDIEDQDTTKGRDWRDTERRGPRGSERDWNRGAKTELDPEWMDAPEPEEKSQMHTQEDFERWKERMKTGNAAKSDAPFEQRPSHNRTISGAGTSGAKVKIDTPLIVDSGVDGFFGLWNEPKNRDSASKLANGVQPAVASTGAKVSKPSKFTGFFNPKPDPESQKGQASMSLFPPSADSSNEDKEGFQRILKLLDQQQQPHDGKSETPPRVQQQREPLESPPIQPPRGGEINDLYSLLGARPPQGNAQSNAMPPTNDSEFLLKLMQQPQQNRQDPNQGNFAGRRAGQDTAPGLLPFSNLTISLHDAPQQTPSTGPPPGFFDDGQNRDKLNPGAERRGPPPGFYDGNHPRQSTTGIASQSGFPAGMQRPPGLDQLPPGYAQHIQAQRQNMMPPPGFQAPRGQNAFPPGLIPSDRAQFGMPTNGRGIPPPGFMHAPPPGFPVPFEGMPFGAFGDGNSFGQGFLPGQPRRQ